MNHMQLATLAEQARNGDNGALEQLYNATHTQMYFFALHTVRNNEDAKDVLQNTYIIVLQKIHTLEKPQMFVAWLKTILANECNRFLRERGKYILPDDETENLFDSLEDETEEFLPGSALFDQDIQRIVLDTIENELSPIQKQTVLLYYYDELKISEIAAITDTNENTVKNRLHESRKKLKKALAPYRSDGILSLGVLALTAILKEAAEKTTPPTEATSSILAAVARASSATSNILPTSIQPEHLDFSGTAAGARASAPPAKKVTAVRNRNPGNAASGTRRKMPEEVGSLHSHQGSAFAPYSSHSAAAKIRSAKARGAASVVSNRENSAKSANLFLQKKGGKLSRGLIKKILISVFALTTIVLSVTLVAHFRAPAPEQTPVGQAPPEEQASILGTWKGSLFRNTLTFNSDGTYTHSFLDRHRTSVYKLSGDKLMLDNQTEENCNRVKLEGDTMILYEKVLSVIPIRLKFKRVP